MEEDIGPYDCAICYNNMMDRSPKLLQCHHSFCTPCLKRMAKRNKIICATCRVSTRVPKGGVDSLTTNFHLVKMLEREEELSHKVKRAKYDLTCQACHGQISVNKCQECSTKICQRCTEEHTKVPGRETHVILRLCQKHFEGITHICLDCVEAVCVDCIPSSHEEHKSKILEYRQGIQVLREELESLRSQVIHETELFQSEAAKGEERLSLNTEVRNAISRIQSILEEHANKATYLMEKINENDINGDSFRKANTDIAEAYGQILSSVDALSTESDEILVQHFTTKKQDLLKQLQDVQAREVQCEALPFVLADPASDSIVELYQKPEEEWLADPFAKVELSNNTLPHLELHWPLQLLHCDQTIFMANSWPRQVLRIDEHGEIIAKYFPYRPKGDVCGLGLYNNGLFIHTENEITRLPLTCPSRHGKGIAVFTPPVRIWKLLVVNNEKIIITDGKNPGNIYDYNPKTDAIRMCVENLAYPTYVSLAHTADGPRYVITIYGDHCLHVYDRHWRFLTSLGKFGTEDGELMNPQATGITNTGTVLVADWSNGRISEFTLAGDFVRHVLTQQHGVTSPEGLAYSSSHLWLTEGRTKEFASVKCFQVAL